MKIRSAAVCAFGASVTIAQSRNLSFIRDTGEYGPELQLVHLYNGQWPTGIAVSKTGRKFSSYPAAFDPNNVNNGSNNVFAVAELVSETDETAYPSRKINSPPGGAINWTTTPPTSANYVDYLIGVQSVVIDSLDRLWILDTGRVLRPDGNQLLQSSYGGPKLIGVNLSNNTVFQTILFPPEVAYPDSYLNDVRIDLRQLTGGRGGYAYITDSSNEGRNGIVVADLATGESWRRLDLAREVRAEPRFLPFIWGQPAYGMSSLRPDAPLGYLTLGADGIALSADGERLYFTPLASRSLYSVPTALLRAREPSSDLLAQAAVVDHGQKGWSDGMETDSNGFVYAGNNEHNSIALFNPANGTVTTFVRDPVINWVDTMSVALDGYLYFTNNQIPQLPVVYPGTDRRAKPWQAFRVKLPNGGTKVGAT